MQKSRGAAWWAHVGGFVSSLVLGALMMHGRYARLVYADEDISL